MTKTILITGATAGIGAASARRFAAGGWRVIATGRRGDRLRALSDEIGEACLPLELDVRELDSADQLAQLSPPWGEIDLLLNNAGLAPPMDALQDAELEPQLNAIQTNITGLVALTRALLPKLIERQGAVINLSSVAATYPYRGGAVYGASKAFVRQFSLDLRCDLAGTGVRVTSIEPGMAETEFSLVRFKGDRERAAAVYQGVKPLSAEDVAEAVVWCATLPEHVNVNRLELMPVMQAFAGFAVKRS